MGRKRNLEILDKAYRARFIRDNFDTIAFIILIAIISIALIILFFLNFDVINFSQISKILSYCRRAFHFNTLSV